MSKKADQVEYDFHDWLASKIRNLSNKDAIDACENIAVFLEGQIEGLRCDMENEEK